jgi:hypothetical protein
MQMWCNIGSENDILGKDEIDAPYCLVIHRALQYGHTLI